MPTISIQWPHVLVDGQNYGLVADTIANNPKLASDIQRALEAWNSEQAAAAASAIKRAQDATATVQALLDARTKAQDELVAAGNAARGSLEGLHAVLDEAGKPIVQREQETLDAQIAELQAKRASIT